MNQNHQNRLRGPVIAVGGIAGATLILLGIGCRTGRGPTPPTRPASGGRAGGGIGGGRPGTIAENARVQMALGNPDNAAPSLRSPEHYLLARPLLAVSYNDTLRFPNWVSWHLSASDIGNAERGQFQPDASLPSAFTQVTPSDYTRSGYDRGHNCPSKDRSAGRAENDQVFLMSNITPQAPELNQGPWADFENYCRTLTGRSGGRNELYITCGHGFASRSHKTIGRARVAVPDFGWKIVVALPERSGDDIARITAQTQVIAVMMPNTAATAGQNWQRYVVSVADIEKATGLRFFDALPQNVADALKRNRNGGDVGDNGRAPRFTVSPTGNAGETGSTNANTAEPAAGQVWVNTRSGVIWPEGSQYYGKTKQGRYMSESEALKAGYHTAEGR